MQHRSTGTHRATPPPPTPSTLDQNAKARHRAPQTIVPAGPPAVAVRTLRVNPLLAAGITIVLLGVLAPAGFAGLRGASSSTADTRTVTFKATADTYLVQQYPQQSTGTATKLVLTGASGANKVGLVRFSLSGIPSTATNVSARLLLTRDGHHFPTSTLSVSTASATWLESVTWQNRPAIGSKIASTGLDPSMLSASVTLGKVPTSGAVAFAVTDSATNDVARFLSREAGASGPRLQVTYQVATTDPSPSPTSTKPSSTSSTSSSSSSTSSHSSSTTSGSASGRCALSAKLVPSCGELWGVAPGAFTDQKRTDALIDFERAVGKTMDIFHAYHKNNDLFPTPDERVIATDPNHPRLLLENYKPSTSNTWAQIANGAADGNIDHLAAYIKSTFNKPFFLTVWHEPENDVNPTAGSGMTAKDFHDMFRHTVLRLRADGVTNAVTVANFQSYPAYSATDWWKDLYPGDDVVDWVAEDAYNQGYTDGKMSGDFAATVDKTKDTWNGFYNWAHANHPDKPVMLAEWGVFYRSDAPGRQAWYFNNVQANLASFPQLKAMVYFDSPQAPKGSTNFTQYPDALAAFKSLINSTAPIAY